MENAMQKFDGLDSISATVRKAKPLLEKVIEIEIVDDKTKKQILMDIETISNIVGLIMM